MFGLKIEGLAQDEKGHYTARVRNGDLVVPVNRKFGSWQTDAGREVLPPVAAWLQQLVRKAERRRAA